MKITNIKMISRLLQIFYLITVVSSQITDGILNNITDMIISKRHSFVNIKIGVLVAKRRNGGFWIEFDPTMPSSLDSNVVRLSTAVCGFPDINETKFNINVMPGCSSMFSGVRKFSSVDTEWFAKAFVENCKNIFLDRNYIMKLWDVPTTFENTVRPDVIRLTQNCFDKSHYHEIPTVYNATTLVPIIQAIPSTVPIHLLDIDAQGADIEILYSVESFLQRIKHVKLECQEQSELGYLYWSRIPNDCIVAERLLISRGFIVHREVNNCGAAEFNLYGRNKMLLYDGSETFEEG